MSAGNRRSRAVRDLVRVGGLMVLLGCLAGPLAGQAVHPMGDLTEKEVYEILCGPDHVERKAAAIELSSRKAAGVAYLREALRHEDEDVRRVALIGLRNVPGWRHVRVAIPDVEAVLADEDRGLRAEAMETLWRRSGSDSLRAIDALLDDPEHALRRRAVQYIGTHGKGRQLAPLVRVLGDEVTTVRREAASQLAAGAFPWQAGEWHRLVEVLVDEDSETRAQGATMLVTTAATAGPDFQRVLPALHEVLRTGPTDMTLAVLEAMRSAAPAGGASLQVLLGLLRAGREVESVIQVLALMRPDPGEVEVLAGLVDDGGDQAVLIVREVLVHWPGALQLLGRALRGEDPMVREAAAAALGTMGGAAVIPALLQALDDTELSVQMVAAEALGRAGQTLEQDGDRQPILTALTGALASEEPLLRMAAAGALGVQGAGAAAALEGLLTGLEATDDEEFKVRLQVVADIGPDHAELLDRLVALTLDPDLPREHRQACLAAIEGSRPPAAPTLVQLLGRPGRGLSERSLRRAAGQALVSQGAGAASVQEQLLEVLENEASPGRLWAARALGAQGAQASTLLPRLEQVHTRLEAAGLAETRLREAVAEAIAAIRQG
jgi:HEAT repeat protein